MYICIHIHYTCIDSAQSLLTTFFFTLDLLGSFLLVQKIRFRKSGLSPGPVFKTRSGTFKPRSGRGKLASGMTNHEALRKYVD